MAPARPIGDLAELIGDARLVLLGESTHGTDEFYRVRADLTRRLVAERGFRGLAVEGDRSAAARVDRYLRGQGRDRSAEEALGDFAGFPGWMWRNQVVVELVEWLGEHGRGSGFHGLDLTSLREGASAGSGDWSRRDTYMADTLDAVYAGTGESGLVVWAHNSHAGDARATETGMVHGEVSLGQLARQRHGSAVRLVGFTTHAGTVTAAADWGGPPERYILRPSLEGSVERLLHGRGVRNGVIDLRGGAFGDDPLVERMVGVVYQPELELWSHYMRVRPDDQFDLLVHVDETTALEPLDGWSAVDEGSRYWWT